MSIKSSIILRPILSEKGNFLSEKCNKYVFEVEKKCNKIEIKEAVENKFKVQVSKVSTLNVKGKRKNMTIRSNGNVLRTNGKRASWKKAIITLEKGSSIDILGGDV